MLSLLSSDAKMMGILRTVRDLELPDCWIGSGFVRNKVWDFLHGYAEPTPLGDIDVIYYDPSNISESAEKMLENKLRAAMATEPWSVKNQARMHLPASEPPYSSTEHALSLWPETATAVAVRLGGNGKLELLAPLGTDDLFSLTVRPTPHWMGKLEAYRKRLARKNWPAKWPKLTVLHVR